MTGGQDIEVANFTVFTVYVTVTPLFVFLYFIKRVTCQSAGHILIKYILIQANYEFQAEKGQSFFSF